MKMRKKEEENSLIRDSGAKCMPVHMLFTHGKVFFVHRFVLKLCLKHKSLYSISINHTKPVTNKMGV